MILIADSGSTKTEWVALDPKSGEVKARINTRGLNPFFVTSEEIVSELQEMVCPSVEGYSFDKIYFYGSGAREEKHSMIRQAINDAIAGGVTVKTDMLGAARAVCGSEPGVACILGTGANSCYYDGTDICENIPPLGYILGDEGSGTMLGKMLLADLCKGLLPEELKQAFVESYPDVDTAMVLRRVYNEPQANRFLASFAPFVRNHIDHPRMHDLVLEAFRAFFRRNVKLYAVSETTQAHFVGSIAKAFESVLREAGEAEGVTVGTVLKTPMEGLIIYHSNPSNQ